MRAGIGGFLLAFSLHSLLKPAVRPLTGARPLTDGGIAVLRGIIGGATGLAGILPTVWSALRGWTKDEQRAVFQPAAVAKFAGTALWLGGTASMDGETIRRFVIGLPGQPRSTHNTSEAVFESGGQLTAAVPPLSLSTEPRDPLLGRRPRAFCPHSKARGLLTALAADCVVWLARSQAVA